MNNMVSSTKRYGLILIAITVAFAIAIIVAITLSQGSKQQSKTKRAGEFFGILLHNNREFALYCSNVPGDVHMASFPQEFHRK